MNGKGYVLFTLFLMASVTLCESHMSDEFSVPMASSEEKDASDEISQRIENMEREGSNYLKKVMEQLQEDRINDDVEEVPDPNLPYTHKMEDDVYNGPFSIGTPAYNISGPTPLPEVEVEISPEAPALSLTKEELTALYQAAVAKASQLKLNLKDSKPKPEEEAHVWEANSVRVKPSHQGQMNGPLSGYYYYYYPIKSFLPNDMEKSKASSPAAITPSATSTKSSIPANVTPPPNHQHVHATVTMIDSPNKGMEPLFMAISSFIGMALMFLFSVLLVPRFPRIKSKNTQFDDDDDMRNVGQIILEAMSGRDCNERLACEIARIFGGLQSDNKTLRILEILLPPDLSEHVTRIRQAADKKTKCGYIMCKAKKPVRPSTENTPPTKPPIKTYKLRPCTDKETAHELWMKHFEKKKPQKVHYYPNRYELVEKT